MRVANYGNLSLGQMMACRLVDTKPLPERMVEIVNRAPRKKHQWKKLIEIKYISFKKISFEHVFCEMAAICLGLNI